MQGGERIRFGDFCELDRFKFLQSHKGKEEWRILEIPVRIHGGGNYEVYLGGLVPVLLPNPEPHALPGICMHGRHQCANYSTMNQDQLIRFSSSQTNVAICLYMVPAGSAFFFFCSSELCQLYLQHYFLLVLLYLNQVKFTS
jgi:hypothetical protein